MRRCPERHVNYRKCSIEECRLSAISQLTSGMVSGNICAIVSGAAALATTPDGAFCTPFVVTTAGAVRGASPTATGAMLGGASRLTRIRVWQEG